MKTQPKAQVKTVKITVYHEFLKRKIKIQETIFLNWFIHLKLKAMQPIKEIKFQERYSG